MDFRLTEEQTEIQNMVRDFTNKEIIPAQEKMDEDHEFPYELWEKWSGLGMSGMLLSDKYGCSSLDTLSYILALEEVSRVSNTFALIWQVHILVSNIYLKFANDDLKNKYLPIYAKGQNSREWIHVEDHCSALFTLYLKGKIGESYNVGSGINLRNIDLVKKILNICKLMKIKIGKKTKIKYVKDRPGHDFRYALNSKKINNNLKWKPKIKFNEGLKNTITWYLENKKFLKDISKKNYEKRLGLKL